MKTMSRLQELIQRLCPNGVEYKQLGEIVSIPTERINIKLVPNGLYVGVENLLKDKEGIIPAPKMPPANDVIKFEANDILIGNIRPYLKKIWLADKDGGTNGDVVLLRIDAGALMLPKFLYYIVSSDSFFSFHNQYAKGAKMPRGDKQKIMEFLIPVPPIEVQEEVVRILDTFSAHAAELQAELQARKEQYDYYRNLLLTFSPSACGCGTDGEQELGLTTPPTSSYKITWKTMGEIFVMKAGKAIPSSEIKDYNPGDYCACFGANGLRGYVPKANKQTNNIIIGRQGALCGNISYAKGPYYATDHAVVIENSPVFDNRFLFHLLVNANLNQYKTSGAQPGLSVEILKNIVIPVPPLDLQLRIASILDRFETLVNDLTQGLPAEIAACRERYEYFRNKLLTFKKIA